MVLTSRCLPVTNDGELWTGLVSRRRSREEDAEEVSAHGFWIGKGARNAGAGGDTASVSWCRLLGVRLVGILERSQTTSQCGTAVTVRERFIALRIRGQTIGYFITTRCAEISVRVSDVMPSAGISLEIDRPFFCRFPIICRTRHCSHAALGGVAHSRGWGGCQ